ncbi:hypothetical protein Xenpb_02002 [Xenorhabdus sp. PB62.4]|nr:hypothetical protein [Xenorhabdus sp. PB62.4]
MVARTCSKKDNPVHKFVVRHKAVPVIVSANKS